MNTASQLEVLSDEPTLLIRRLRLAPGEATIWHRDLCRRFTVVVRGDALTIEYADGGAPQQVPVAPGLAGWDEPEDRVHRAVNSGSVEYEEVVSFFRDAAVAEPQPRAPGAGDTDAAADP